VDRRFTLDYTRHSTDTARLLRRTATLEETILWERVRNSRLGLPFRRQAPLGPYVVDFLCLKASLIVELDGSGHLKPDAKAYDRARDEYLHARGFVVLRFFNSEVRDRLDEVIDKIRGMMRRDVSGIES
jgi:very-short-patch-repair endonuclease